LGSSEILWALLVSHDYPVMGENSEVVIVEFGFAAFVEKEVN
jgi:hypothetical protein